MNARPSRHLCTAYGCTRPVGLNGFFCAQDWAKLGESRQDEITRADRMGRGLVVRNLVRDSRRYLAACKTTIVKLHASPSSAKAAAC